MVRIANRGENGAMALGQAETGLPSCIRGVDGGRIAPSSPRAMTRNMWRWVVKLEFAEPAYLFLGLIVDRPTQKHFSDAE
jgi:hypothetical protein